MFGDGTGPLWDIRLQPVHGWPAAILPPVVNGAIGEPRYPATVHVLAAGGHPVVKRKGELERNLFHHGNRIFNPSGAEAVRIRFTPETGRATTIMVVDVPMMGEASR